MKYYIIVVSALFLLGAGMALKESGASRASRIATGVVAGALIGWGLYLFINLGGTP